MDFVFSSLWHAYIKYALETERSLRSQANVQLFFKIIREKVTNMNIKKVLICLSIVVISSHWVPNVVAASTSEQTTNVHSRHVMDVPGKEQPGLALLLNDNVTSVNKSVEFVGPLATGTQTALHPIEGATVNIQRMSYNGTAWQTLSTVQTPSTGKEAGIFEGSYTPKSKGYHILWATYDGNSNYAPTVSNVVALIVN